MKVFCFSCNSEMVNDKIDLTIKNAGIAGRIYRCKKCGSMVIIDNREMDADMENDLVSLKYFNDISDNCKAVQQCHHCQF